jgi:hypothetical protein
LGKIAGETLRLSRIPRFPLPPSSGAKLVSSRCLPVLWYYLILYMCVIYFLLPFCLLVLPNTNPPKAIFYGITYYPCYLHTMVIPITISLPTILTCWTSKHLTSKRLITVLLPEVCLLNGNTLYHKLPWHKSCSTTSGGCSTTLKSCWTSRHQTSKCLTKYSDP